ncbi:MAG: L-2-hydroxyglutarate oxidase [Deltaproteobacteria bacterium]|nr:MAG: L-2-hydroxyglutarate oxidase [Deltaproteobacteria bacterium]
MPASDPDLLVVGGGIVGLACAHAALTRWPNRRVLLLEKERRLASHQTGRNSGVIHSGIYYRPGSRKARLCREGRTRLLALCEEAAIPHRLCGKVIVATTEDETGGLERLRGLAVENGVAATPLDGQGLRRIEPHAGGVAALHVPEAGVVDFGQVCEVLAGRIEASGGEIRPGTPVRRLERAGDAIRAHLAGGEVIEAGRALACAGLHADRLARRSGLHPPVAIVPFRGEYHALAPEVAERVRALLYPVPDPGLPFLGVHVTRHIDDRVTCGPNAVLAWAREGYRKGALRPGDALDNLRAAGLWRLARHHLGTGVSEMLRSYSRRRFARDVARLLPGVEARHLRPARAGVRAQALFPDGRLADDFELLRDGPALHVLNAPSPAATAALAIAEHLLDALDASDT